jgi:hypothetical protein
MRIRISPLIAGALCIAGTAMAQMDTTRRTSTTRIPISKEPARVDTVTVVRTDTVTRTVTRRVHDTVRVTRVDTVKTAAGVLPRRIREIGGFYIGFGAGAAVPTGNDFTTFQGTGWNIQVPTGWDPLFIPIGARVNFSYSQFGKQGVFDQAFTTPEIFQIDGDVKVRYPVKSPWMRRYQVYALGGLTYSTFRSLALFNEDDGLVTIGDLTGTATEINFGLPSTIDNSWHNQWGWNAGGGFQMGWKHANVFIESRFIQFSHNGFHVNQVPIVVGASWIGTDWW